MNDCVFWVQFFAKYYKSLNVCECVLKIKHVSLMTCQNVSSLHDIFSVVIIRIIILFCQFILAPELPPISFFSVHTGQEKSRKLTFMCLCMVFSFYDYSFCILIKIIIDLVAKLCSVFIRINVYIQGDHKVSLNLMVTIQKVTSNVKCVPRQSPV
jgi:hypothetical protein